jgi:hypothetical protein
MAPVVTDLTWFSGLSLSEHDRLILTGLLDPRTEVESLVGSMEPQQLWEAIECSIGTYSDYKRALALLKPVIGRLLIALRDYPELYQSRGYINYDDFLTRGCRELFSLPRSEAYRIIRLVEKFPDLTPTQFAEIGEGKLYALSTFTNSADPACAGWLEIAKSSTLDELKDKMIQRGENTNEGLIVALVSIQTNLEVKKAWTAFVSNPAVQSTVGSEDAGQILFAMIGEAASSWGV